MNVNLRLLACLALVALLNGCGYLVQVNRKVDYPTVALGTRRGELWKQAPAGCQACTEDFLRTQWGEPSSRAVDETGTTVWTYNHRLKWVGASPIVVIPLPLFLPSGKEKIQFGLKEGRIVFVRHFTIRRMFVYLPTDINNDITGSLYDNTAPATGCVFKRMP